MICFIQPTIPRTNITVANFGKSKPWRKKYCGRNCALGAWATNGGDNIELDGPIHNEQKEYDAARDNDLTKRGFKVIRYKNDEVLFDRERVLQEIKGDCEKRMTEISNKTT